MECEQDPTLMEEKLIEGGVHTYANVTAIASSLKRAELSYILFGLIF